MATVTSLRPRSSPFFDTVTAEIDRRALSRESLLVTGRAGSGKSEALRGTALALLGGGLTPIVLTFGNAAAAELRSRGVAGASTFDALCGAIGRAAGFTITAGDWKSYNALRARFFHFHERAAAERLIALFRDGGLGLSPSSPTPAYDPQRSLAQQLDALALVETFLDHALALLPFDIDAMLPRVHGFVCALIAAKTLPLGWASYLVAELRLPVGQRYDAVLVDEVQDCAGAQLSLIRHLASRGRQVLAFGDDRQAIMAWRGAHPNAMQTLADDHRMRPILMSHSRRCARAIARHAAEIVTDFTTYRTEEGEVLHLGYDGSPPWQPRDLVLCRTASPLFTLAFEARAAGHDVRLAPALVKRFARVLAMPFDDLGRVAGSRPDDLALPEDDGEIDDTLAHAAVALSRALVGAGINTANEALPWFAATFTDNWFFATRAIGFSTIHGAKGTEAPRVFIVDPWRMPHARAASLNARREEENLSYVARTRARDALAYVDVNRPPPQPRLGDFPR